MKITKNKVFSYIMIFFWGVIVLWNFFTPTRVFSEAENRELNGFPQFSVATLLDGRFMDSMNDYLDDQFAGRDYCVRVQSVLEYTLGKRELNGIYIGNNAMLPHLSAENKFSAQNIAGVNDFAAQYGIPTCIMLVPSSASVQPELLPLFAESWDEQAYISNAYSRMDSGVVPVSVFETLRSHSEEYIFYRTDHHWTTYGAWLGYQKLASALGLEAHEQNDFEKTVLSTGFYGSYNSKTGFPFIGADTMELYEYGRANRYEVFSGSKSIEYPSVYFEEFLNQKDKYSFFMGQVQPLTKIYTESASGKRLIVFKDSYAHSLLPMIFSDYSEITLVDLRFYSSNDYGAALGIADYDQALFLYSADVFAHQPGAGQLLV